MPEDIILENKTYLTLSNQFCSIVDLAKIVTEHADATSRPLLLHGQHLEQCSLASPALTKDSQYFILLHFETESIHLILLCLPLSSAAFPALSTTCLIIFAKALDPDAHIYISPILLLIFGQCISELFNS